MLKGEQNCTRWFYNLDISIIPLEQKKTIILLELQCSAKNGGLSLLSERGNFEHGNVRPRLIVRLIVRLSVRLRLRVRLRRVHKAIFVAS